MSAIRVPKRPIEAELQRPWFRAYRFRSIIDVGANEGQFATWARAAFPNAQLYSFEPLPECNEALRAKFAGDPRFEAFDVALGAAPATVEMHRNDYTPASSLLMMDATHKTAFPQTSKATTIKVECRTLDDVFSSREVAQPLFVKLDVQGYESQVLAGGPQTLKKAQVVLVELSLEHLYRGELLFDEVYRQIVSSGFVLCGMIDQLRRPADQKPLQVDAVFERR